MIRNGHAPPKQCTLRTLVYHLAAHYWTNIKGIAILLLHILTKESLDALLRADPAPSIEPSEKILAAFQLHNARREQLRKILAEGTWSISKTCPARSLMVTTQPFDIDACPWHCPTIEAYHDMIMAGHAPPHQCTLGELLDHLGAHFSGPNIPRVPTLLQHILTKESLEELLKIEPPVLEAAPAAPEEHKLLPKKPSRMKAIMDHWGHRNLPDRYSRICQSNAGRQPMVISLTHRDKLVQRLSELLTASPDDSMLRIHQLSLEGGLEYKGAFYFCPFGFEGDGEDGWFSNVPFREGLFPGCQRYHQKDGQYICALGTHPHTPHQSYISFIGGSFPWKETDKYGPCAFKQISPSTTALRNIILEKAGERLQPTRWDK